ncbi:MAG TPA: RluA family pseudouridine synthase [Thermoanaerobaculia bacterium]|nr:RluA family pseudouridine synthase [Thermoanaerobaculia bacterium]
MRLDQAIAARFEISRRKARQQIAAGRVLLNRRRVAVASREVSPSDELTLLPETAERLQILALTDDWVAVDKPAGLPTQPTRDRSDPSLEDLVRAQYRSIYLVHRLDRPTSGIVLFARTREAAAKLSSLFASGEIRKTYFAVAEGVLEQDETIDSPIGGKEARTVVRPIRKSDGGTLVEIDLLTGRTHQIRLHLASIGHPVAGDRRYGSTINTSRLMLHAWRLEHAELGTIESPIPPEFT